MNRAAIKSLSTFALLVMSLVCFAQADDLAGVADTLKSNFESLAKLVTAGAFLAGMGFAVGAILKFKQHKDNPTQIPVGTPIAMLFISAALLFLPSIMKVAGKSIFGDSVETGGVEGKAEFLN